MTTREQLKHVATGVDKVILQLIQEESKTSNKISPLIEDVLKRIVNLTAKGGKRLRAAFMYHSYILFNGKDSEEILKTSAFIEIIHTWLLIHDDLMDRANLRRGYLTLHKVYSDIYKHKMLNNRGAKHFGVSQAVNIGDLFSQWGTKILVDSSFNPELKIRALSKANRNLMDVAYGQILDVYEEVEGDIDEEYVLQVYLYKTGYYTYETPLHVGAILAGAQDSDLETLTKYALPGGIAFQIIDDIIDMFAGYKKTGKLPGVDIKEGKQTLLTYYAKRNATEQQKKILKNALGNRGIKKEDIEDVKKVMIDTGALEYSQKKAKKYLRKSTKALESIQKNVNPEGLDFLKGINDLMYERMEAEDNNKR
jgi:geranylgeranyl diphosphate synthase type I